MFAKMWSEMQPVLEQYLAAPHEPLRIVVPARFGNIGIVVNRVDVEFRCICGECAYALRLECPSENIDWTACGSVCYGFCGGVLTKYCTDHTRMDAATFRFSADALRIIANPGSGAMPCEESRSVLRHTN